MLHASLLKAISATCKPIKNFHGLCSEKYIEVKKNLSTTNDDNKISYKTYVKIL